MTESSSAPRLKTDVLGTLDNQSFAFDPNDRLNTDTYDANGNTLFGAGFNQTQADRYDFENRLIERRSTIASVTRTVNIAYDGDGQRVSKTVNGATTFYLVDELNPTGYAQVLEELAVNGAQLVPFRIYAYGHDLLSQDQLFDTGTNLVWNASFYGYDGHGSTRYLTDVSGAVTDTYDYDSFGNLIAQTGTTPNLYLYSGEQFDPDLGLYYLRARYHNPQTGRFWSMDSFEGFGQDPASLHKYAYCANNPVNSVDPSGRMSIPELNMSFAIGLTTRTILGAVVGGMTGSLAAGYDSILHGRVTDAEIGAAMRVGFREGATAGAFFAFTGSFGAVGAFGASSIGLVYSGLGFMGAYQSYLSGNEAAGDFEAGLATISTVLSSVGMTRALTSVYRAGNVSYPRPLVTQSPRFKQTGANEFVSTRSGLVYGEDPILGNRINHVLKHTQENLGRSKHGVFDEGSPGVFDLIDDAWTKVRLAGPAGSPDVQIQPPGWNSRQSYLVNMRRRIGQDRNRIALLAS